MNPIIVNLWTVSGDIHLPFFISWTNSSLKEIVSPVPFDLYLSMLLPVDSLQTIL